MQSLYRSPLSLSMSCFIVTNPAPKTGDFNCGKPFGGPIYQGDIEKDQDASARVPSELVAGLVTATHHPDFNLFAMGRRHIVRDGFMDISIEFNPVMSWAAGFINDRIGQVKNKRKLCLRQR